MKKLYLTAIIVLLATTLQAQHRDRRADLDVRCYTNLCVSSSGRLWMSTACSMIYTADDIHSSWRTANSPKEERFLNGGFFERMAAFGDKILVAAGFLNGREEYDFVLRTSNCGKTWDTVVIDPRLDWVHDFSYRSDGHIWLGSASGRSEGILAHSSDSGRSFQVLRTDFDGETGIHTLFMFNTDSGYVGNYTNSIFSTSDNWRTIHRITAPFEQIGGAKHDNDGLWINRIRQWNDYLIVTEGNQTFITPLKGTIHWERPAIELYDYEVDSLSGALWAISDSGQLARLTNWDKVQHFNIKVAKIIEVINGKAYCVTYKNSVIRIAPDGKTDTCPFYTDERPIEKLPMILKHGTLTWGSDGKSIYLQDAKGWYRVAAPLRVNSLMPHPELFDRIVCLGYDNTNYTVDSAGNIEPYIIAQPFGDFVKAGLQEVCIETFRRGCFHYISHNVRYKQENGILRETYNDVEEKSEKRELPVEEVEQALLRLGERYNIFPTPQDFSLQDASVDLRAVYDYGGFFSSNHTGYYIVIVNSTGDTLRISNDVCEGNKLGGGTRFPWLLPMNISMKKADFVSYQPCLWHTLRKLMPDTMRLFNQLNNNTLQPNSTLQNGDLIFYTRQNYVPMEKALQECSGEYTRVALVECDSANILWIIEAIGDTVRRIPYSRWHIHDFDVFRFAVPFDTAAVIKRAKSFVGMPRDKAFLPDNNAIYNSELIYEAFLDSNGNHLFEAKPMNFRNKKGRTIKYWRKHFKELGMPIPEGVLGTTPYDLSQSKLLIKL